MLTDVDWARIARYVLGEVAHGDLDRERSWVDAKPERQAVAKELAALRAAARLPEPPWNADRAWRRLLDATPGAAARSDLGPIVRPERAAAKERHGNGTTLHVWRADPPRARSGIAAACVAAVVAAILLWRLHAGVRDPIVMRELSTAPGQRVTLALGDGTRITLGPASTLRYPTDFPHTGRAIELDGEGYFEVHHDPTRPLVVRTARAETEDVGTTFVVRDYRADSEPQVTVADGRVSVSVVGGADAGHDRRSRTVVSRGQVGTVTSGGTIIVRNDVDLGPETAWARGELVFRHARLRDVLPELSRWYDIDIRLAEPSLGELEVTTSFKDEPLNEALNALSAALGLIPDRNGRTVVLRRHDAPRAANGSSRPVRLSFTSSDPDEAQNAP